MKNLNNINYSLQDAEELSKQLFQNKNIKPLIRKPRKSEDILFPQSSKSPRRKRKKRYNETSNKGNL